MKRIALFAPIAALAASVVLLAAVNLPRPAASGSSEAQTGEVPAVRVDARLFDPVCRMEVNPAWKWTCEHEGRTLRFCNDRCKALFLAAPGRYLGPQCVVCNGPLDAGPSFTATYLGKPYELCSEEHRTLFKQDPAAQFLHVMWGLPPWLYYASIAGVLLVSFGLFDILSRREVPAPHARPQRLDLLAFAPVRWLVRSRPARFALQAVAVGLFVLVIAAGLFGSQNPATNIAPLLTWTVWWGLLPVLILFAGKAWCYVCPWDAVAGWAEKLSLWRKASEGLSLALRWPRAVRNISIATILFVGLTWVELGFGVTMKPRVTAYLALGMVGLAVVSALLFDRKSFCRYGCLVGRVSGLYAQFAGVEVRAKDAARCSSCSTKECVRGSATAYGCPTYLYPGKLSSNTYCIQCMECTQACPHDNIALNLRPFASDLVVEGNPRSDEAYLALLMLSITGFHGFTMTPLWERGVEAIRTGSGVGRIAAFSVAMTALLAAPIALYALITALSFGLGRSRSSRPLGYHDYFVRYAYALLPIALSYHIAHNLEHLLMEGPKIVAMISDPFGWGWNLLGTAAWNVPPLISLDQLWLAQVLLVLAGHVYSLWVAQKTSIRLFGGARAALWSQIPMLAAMVLFSVFSLWLLKQPMEMRTSAM